MTKNEIIADIKWRIKDYKEEHKFWLDKLNELPTEEQAKQEHENLCKIGFKKIQNGELFALKEAHEYLKNWEKNSDEARYNAFLALVRYDALERLLNSILDEEGKK